MWTQYDWPGNVRELRHTITRMALTGRVELPARSERAPTTQPPQSVPATDLERMQLDLREAEKRQVIDALARFAGSQTKAARALGISRRTLTKRLNKYGLPRPRKALVPD
jgi:DNA-binding NtrC family response regulator